MYQIEVYLQGKVEPMYLVSLAETYARKMQKELFVLLGQDKHENIVTDTGREVQIHGVDIQAVLFVDMSKEIMFQAEKKVWEDKQGKIVAHRMRCKYPDMMKTQPANGDEYIPLDPTKGQVPDDLLSDLPSDVQNRIRRGEPG